MRWAQAGHEVIIGSRDGEKAQRVAEELNLALGGAKLSGADNMSAATACEIVVLSVPYTAHKDTISAVLPALDGKVVIDVTVPMNPTDYLRVMVPAAGSASKETQIMVPTAKVIAAFQNISAVHLKKLDAQVDCDVLVCGDDDDAKKIGLQLVKDVGMQGWDAGPLDNAVAVESLTPILLGINKRHKIKGAGIRITGHA